MSARARPGLPTVAAAALALAALGAVGGCGHTPAKAAPATPTGAAVGDGAPPSATPAAVTTAAATGAPATSAPRRHWYWPFGSRRTGGPAPVEELVIRPAPGSQAEFLQFWERNTLVVDMRSAQGSGGATLTPREHTLWPVRLVFRVEPGRIGQLEVRAEERTVFAVATSGAAPVDLALDPSAYAPRTPEIVVAWGPAQTLPVP